MLRPRKNHADSKSKPVLSAEKVAAVRALGAGDPRAKNPDALAAHFLGSKHRLLVWLLSRLPQVGCRFVEGKSPGAYWYLQARTKHIDRALAHALAEGVAQVVILGAGYDTRPYRFRDRLVGVPVFEVDVQSTQEQKKRHLQTLYGTLPTHVTFVAIDFNKESLPEVLTAAGYDATKRTCVLWEGVIYYLPEESVRAVLVAIRDLTPPGSTIVFDYILNAGLAGDESLYGAKEAMQLWNAMGEPGLFGFDGDSAAREFMRSMGFEVTSDIDSREMERRYDACGESRPAGRITECMRFMDAVVR